MAYRFTIQNAQELRDLSWIADRYDSAAVLHDCVWLDWTDDPSDAPFPLTVEVPEHKAWECLDATEGDGGYRGMIPCLGGRLGEEIHAMLDSVV